MPPTNRSQTTEQANEWVAERGASTNIAPRYDRDFALNLYVKEYSHGHAAPNLRSHQKVRAGKVVLEVGGLAEWAEVSTFSALKAWLAHPKNFL